MLDTIREAAKELTKKKYLLEQTFGVPLVIDSMRWEDGAVKVKFRAEVEKARFIGCGDPSCCGVKFDPDAHYVGEDGLIYRRIDDGR